MATTITTNTNVMRAFVTIVIVVCVVVSLAAQDEAIAEVRVHGNHTTPSADILALAALAVGEAATPERLAAAEERLRASGRFESVEVRRRYRSIAEPSEILVIVLVNEHGTPVPMLLPVVAKRDGHALTYGGRVTFVDALGAGMRVSAPLTWGGERRAAVEIERAWLRGSVAIRREINPHVDVEDERRELRLQAEHALMPWLRVGAFGRASRVTFGGASDWVRAAGGSLTVDTRTDASFPRNAVHARFGITRLMSRLEPAPTYEADLRGYLGLLGSTVLALRGQASHAGAPLPVSEWALTGGSESLRGYRAGHRAGDSMAAISAELRVPLTSPLRTGRLGMKAFVDAGAAWRSGERLREQQFDRGAGGGVFFGVAGVSAGVDVAWPERGRPRVHLKLGIEN